MFPLLPPPWVRPPLSLLAIVRHLVIVIVAGDSIVKGHLADIYPLTDLDPIVQGVIALGDLIFLQNTVLTGDLVVIVDTVGLCHQHTRIGSCVVAMTVVLVLVCVPLLLSFGGQATSAVQEDVRHLPIIVIGGQATSTVQEDIHQMPIIVIGGQPTSTIRHDVDLRLLPGGIMKRVIVLHHML